ncbi:alpha-crystallin A chain-like [Tetranychus urticae]|uniref:alpha-crystallin A chain-like n=1 Tax=Tetranychus urticae TaxID=32264 RepID=UPI00077BB67F|nr:alpha-crystallin A chain-like [Tetranychus urticae]
MSLVPRLIDTMFRDSFDEIYPIIAYREPVMDYPRRSWGQMNRALRQLDQLSKHLNQEMATIKDSEDKFEVNVDCAHFKPEEINVKLSDNNLVVEAKHEERSDEHGYISRSFKRRYVLPENVEFDKLQSNLGVDGVLSIKAPKKVVNAVTGEKKIPITLTNQVHQPVESGDKAQTEKMETK